MINRCTYPSVGGYKHYGGRGIRVHPRWRVFANFLADVGERPSQQHTIDRYPDVNGNYEPGNVRWATREQQASNRTDNRRIEAFGKVMTLAEWSRSSGIKEDTIAARIDRGWSNEAAIETPLQRAGGGRRLP